MQRRSSRIAAPAASQTIRCDADLRALVRRKRYRRTRTSARIAVELPSLSTPERERWSNTLTAEFHECGCRHGAAFLLVGCVLLLARFAHDGFRPLGAWYLAVGPSLLIALSGVGKAVGIFSSRIRLRRSVDRLLGR